MSRIAFLFTGQGSQYAGMGRALADSSAAARETFAEADAALAAIDPSGPRLTTLCFEGPEDALALTANTQPATLAVSVAAFRAFGRTPDAAAGHSLGEISALVAAGALALGDAVRLVRRRGALMQEAVPAGVGAMTVIRKLALDDARAAVERVAAAIPDEVLELANYNSPGQYVAAGTIAALDALEADLGPKRTMRLPVSVPFHSRLLAPAAARFADVLAATPMRDPAFPIWTNADAQPVSTAAGAREALVRQMASPVLWEQTMRGLIAAGFRTFVELGPKKALYERVDAVARELGVSDALARTRVEDTVTLASAQAAWAARYA